MPDAAVPRNVMQNEVVRALVRAGGIEDRKAGKGSHVRVTMPNGAKVFVPYGGVKVGTLRAVIRQAGLSVDRFVELL